MHRRQCLALSVFLALPLSLGAQDGVLRVIRSSPGRDATISSQITVAFDRPVAGSLDRSVDASRIVRIEPAVAGKIEWRDPVTIRFKPAQLLTSGTTYTVTVANSFMAMDGSALKEPYVFSFRVQGPALLASLPIAALPPEVRRNSGVPRIVPTQRFQLVYSSPVDLTRISATALIEPVATCGGREAIRLTAASQRRIRSDDPGRITEAGGWSRDHALDSLRRVVSLVPVTTLPRGCGGVLVVPAEVSEQPYREPARIEFETYGDFRIDTVACGSSQSCPTGPVRLVFSTPVKGSEVLRRVSLLPAVKFTVSDTAEERTGWTLDARLKLHTSYAVVVDTAIRDVIGQRLTGNPASGLSTTGYEPAVNYAYGRQVVERVGFRSLAVQHVNVDTLVVVMAQVPRALEAQALGMVSSNGDSLWAHLKKATTEQRVAVKNHQDTPMITSVRLPTLNAMRPGTPTLFAIRVGARSSSGTIEPGPTSIVQVTDLGAHVRMGVREAVVWVTGVNDGKARGGAVVNVHNGAGKVIATGTTNAEGIARFTDLKETKADASSSRDEESDGEECCSRGQLEGFVSVTLGTDRALTAINAWDPDLSPYHFNVSEAEGDERRLVAGTVFTERGIYRPGERVYAKAIVRSGALGALRAMGAGDSVRWTFHDRENAVLRQVTTSVSSFGTADQSYAIPAGAAVGDYTLELHAGHKGTWSRVAQASYRVAEYRPPEFLVDLTSASKTLLPGDPYTVTAQARYLFGAPMGHAEILWVARLQNVAPWDLAIPGTDGWYLGEVGNWWEESREITEALDSRVDTLDPRGTRTYSFKVPPSPKGRAARVSILGSVTDVNRQVVGTTISTIVHPAEFYIAAKSAGDSWFWKAGTPQTVQVITVRPTGERMSNVHVRGTIVRREWHRVRRERDGVSQMVGEWVSDTVARCNVTTGAEPAPCSFTPKEGGEYIVRLAATDARGHDATTAFTRWGVGSGWVPWSDETQFKMNVIPDRTRYSVGDTATIMFASPFTDADAWITVEREGLIEQRRLRITSGSTTLKFPITEAYAPNAFVSIIVARGRSAKPGYLDDLGRPTIRVGYAELRVTPEVKRLTVSVSPERPEYRPADSARVRVHVADREKRPAQSEVTLWAVDAGVLALTGYKTPDPLDLIYRARGLGMRLASNLTAVAPQVPEGEKGWRNAGGGGGAAGSEILRSKFQTTAFFLGSVVTDAQGNGVAAVKLPDNVTTFRIMAVAVTRGDRFGSGDSSILVTRPLLARQALPRFVRPGDAFTAGAVISRRDGAAVPVKVTATVNGATLRAAVDQTATLAALRGTEVRFPFTALKMDSVAFRFDVSDGRNADAVRVAIPEKPDHHPVTETYAGVVQDSVGVDLAIPAGLDLTRSTLSLQMGASPTVAILGMADQLRVYPYLCTEQVASNMIALSTLLSIPRERVPDSIRTRAIADLKRGAAMLTARQRSDGGIGYWSPGDWTTAWLSAYAGLALLDARAAAPADTILLGRIANYLSTTLHGKQQLATFSPVAQWSDTRDGKLREQLAAADFLSRFGRPDIATENDLVRAAAQMSVEDRARLAEVVQRRRQTAEARRLLEPTWALLKVEGRRAVLAESLATPFYFQSRIRPIARILTATLSIDPTNPLLGPLVETLLQQRGRMWNTQDLASSVVALAAFELSQRPTTARDLRVRYGDRTLLQAAANAQGKLRDSSLSLANVIGGGRTTSSMHLTLDAGRGTGALYYYLSLREIPAAPPVTPENQGIQVERWYEKLDGITPVTSVAEGELVRVRLRITVPATRYFVVVDDALPAGLEAVDLSLRTASAAPGPGVVVKKEAEDHDEPEPSTQWYGSWDAGWWSPFDHRELRDDRVVYSATLLWRGTFTATYVARATTPGTFIRPPVHVEEMYNPALYGRSDGGTFVVTSKTAPR